MRNRKILIVDDDQDVLQDMHVRLKAKPLRHLPCRRYIFGCGSSTEAVSGPHSS